MTRWPFILLFVAATSQVVGFVLRIVIKLLP